MRNILNLSSDAKWCIVLYWMFDTMIHLFVIYDPWQINAASPLKAPKMRCIIGNPFIKFDDDRITY